MNETSPLIRGANVARLQNMVNDANQRANTKGCCGCVHEFAMVVEVALIVAAVVLVILGATAVVPWLYAGIALVITIAIAASVGIAYNRAYIILGTLKAVVDELQEEITNLNGLVTNLEQTANDLRGENARYVEANVNHEKIVDQLKMEVEKQVTANQQLQEALQGYQSALKKYESLVEIFEGKIQMTAKDLSEQHGRVEKSAGELESLESRLERCLTLYEKKLEENRGIAHRAEILVRQFVHQIDLGAQNLKDADANLEKEKELNEMQQKSLITHQKLSNRLMKVSDELEENIKQFALLNADFDLTKEELEEFRRQISTLSDRCDLQKKVMEGALKKVQTVIDDGLKSADSTTRQKILELGERILRALRGEYAKVDDPDQDLESPTVAI